MRVTQIQSIHSARLLTVLFYFFHLLLVCHAASVCLNVFSAVQYGVDVHPLSIHRGNEGTLTPLVTAASANQRFVAFAQVPLITTVVSHVLSM